MLDMDVPLTPIEAAFAAMPAAQLPALRQARGPAAVPPRPLVARPGRGVGGASEPSAGVARPGVRRGQPRGDPVQGPAARPLPPVGSVAVCVPGRGHR